MLYFYRLKKEEMYNNEQQRLGYTEFCDFFMDNLSHLITNQEHILQNESFYEEAQFKLFELYLSPKFDGVSILNIISIFEVFLYAMFKYTPDTELPEDKITLI
jgi:hypothetical protein